MTTPARERTTFGQSRTLGHQLAPLDTWGTRHFMRPDEAAAARKIVCANAVDAADARRLMRMLGILPERAR